ncbi:Zinc finger protein [Plakobranchus ocellatus]|uniref:Zinc finger protein n=1 Tax=Plakobranchus ocellatus TaxID=259542 RepID=A0AAV4C454_9GAST|nr:Zinc finger protein [Plakobranchus ocellatus]
MSFNNSTVKGHRVENYSDTEIEEDNASFGKDDAFLSSDETQSLETEAQTSTQKVDKRKEKCGNKPKVKIKTLTIDGQLVYFCKICDKIFTRRKDKLNHELAHSGETMLTCTECGKEYLHESSLASHMRTHDGDPLFMCDLCPKMFAQSHHLKTHILSHSEPTNFTCKTCYKEFATAADLSHHNRSLISQEMSQYWCKMCKVYFCRTHGPSCDRRIHAYCCSACNELFFTHKKLKIHMRKFAHFSFGKPDFIEPLTEQELYPDKVPEGIKRSQSAKENSILKQSYQNPPLREAKRLANEDVENIVPRKKFKLSPRKVFVEDEQSSTSIHDSAPEERHGLDSDLRSPCKFRKGKPYCKKCNKSFKDSSELERHRAIVHEESPTTLPPQQSFLPFMCKICNSGFSTKDDLERHGFKHSGERMHVCPMCGEEFPQAVQLTKHLKTHMGDHPYRCSQCGKSFRLKIQLIQHVRLHIVQDANSCDKCPSKFNTRAELQDHMVQAHRDVFRCHLCGKAFNLRQRLLAHLHLHHRTPQLEVSTLAWSQVGFKRSLSTQDVDNLGSIEIKTEPLGSDCESEQSFCSSFTRDSERSDVFRFSSDESYSFKTTMAKERIRLRRRWKRSQRKLLDQISRQDVKDENYDPSGADCSMDMGVKLENKDGEEPQKDRDEEDDKITEPEDVVDMMVELNAVQSEADSITTVFVNVTQKLAAAPALPTLLDQETDVYTKGGMNQLDERYMRDFRRYPQTLTEKMTKNYQNILDPTELRVLTKARKENSNNENILILEFDPVDLGVTEDELPKLSQFSELSANALGEMELGSVDSSDNITEHLHESLRLSKTSPETVTTASTHASNLARLQEVFQNSSKYLPLPQISHSNHTENCNLHYNSQLHTSPGKAMCQSSSDRDFQDAKDKNINLQSYNVPKVISQSNFSASQGETANCVSKGISQAVSMISVTKETKVALSVNHNQKISCAQVKKKHKASTNTLSTQVTQSHSLTKMSHGQMTEAVKPIQFHLGTHEPVAENRDISKPVSALQSSSSFSLSHLNARSELFSSYKPSSSLSSQATSVNSSTVTTALTVPVSSTIPPSGSYAKGREKLSLSSQSSSAVPSIVAAQATTIFDTNNPLLRDMNMMDLVKANTPVLPPLTPTPQHPASKTLISLPHPTPVVQPIIPFAMAHPVNVSDSSTPSALSSSIHFPLPQNPPPVFHQPPAVSQVPVSMPTYGMIEKPKVLDLHSTQSNISISNHHNNNHLFGPGVQGASAFTPQLFAGLGPSQNFQNPSSINADLGQAFSLSLQQQQQQQMQQQLIIGQPAAPLINMGNVLDGGGASLGGLGNAGATTLNAQMKSLQEMAFKESLYLSGSRSNNFPQMPGAVPMGGLNHLLQPNISDLVNAGLSSGPLNIGIAGATCGGNLMGATSANFGSLHGDTSLGLGGQIPTALHPTIINVINNSMPPSFVAGVGLSEQLRHHSPSFLGPSFSNTSVMLPGGPTPLLTNQTLGTSDPSGYLPHFSSFPHL